MAGSRDRICRKCGTRYNILEQCPVCDSGCWEYVDARVREYVANQEPLQTPMLGSSADYYTVEPGGEPKLAAEPRPEETKWPQPANKLRADFTCSKR